MYAFRLPKQRVVTRCRQRRPSRDASRNRAGTSGAYFPNQYRPLRCRGREIAVVGQFWVVLLQSLQTTRRPSSLPGSILGRLVGSVLGRLVALILGRLVESTLGRLVWSILGRLLDST